jgi:hypothetical protein
MGISALVIHIAILGTVRKDDDADAALSLVCGLHPDDCSALQLAEALA